MGESKKQWHKQQMNRINQNYIMYKNMKSREFETYKGLRQGGVMSSTLFTKFKDGMYP